jgi:hypothetical protein
LFPQGNQSVNYRSSLVERILLKTNHSTKPTSTSQSKFSGANPDVSWLSVAALDSVGSGFADSVSPGSVGSLVSSGALVGSVVGVCSVSLPDCEPPPLSDPPDPLLEPPELVGFGVGFTVGEAVGFGVGETVGETVGEIVGETVTGSVITEITTGGAGVVWLATAASPRPRAFLAFTLTL